MGADKLNIVIVGLGSLAKKLVPIIAAQNKCDSITVFTRSKRATLWCEVASLVYSKNIRCVPGNALDNDELSKFLISQAPDIIFQTASLLSPFCFMGTRHEKLSQSAGFALQLSAQLPIAYSVCNLTKRHLPNTTIVNCSFPDVVNPILGRLGCAPDLGLGNSGIIEYLIRKQSKKLGEHDNLHVIAHHVHAIQTLKAHYQNDIPEPLIFVNNQKVAWDTVRPVFSGPLSGEEINVITAESARHVISSLCDSNKSCAVSVAGPLGNTGGRPIRVENATVSLNYPMGFNGSDLDEYFNNVQRYDGIDSIDGIGTVHFTDKFVEEVKPLFPLLCEPLNLSNVMHTYTELKKCFHET